MEIVYLMLYCGGGYFKRRVTSKKVVAMNRSRARKKAIHSHAFVTGRA